MKDQPTVKEIYANWSKLAEKKNDSPAQKYFYSQTEEVQKELKKLMIKDLNSK